MSGAAGPTDKQPPELRQEAALSAPGGQAGLGTGTSSTTAQIWLPLVATLALLAVVALALVHIVSPYIDTAFQVGISDTRSFSGFIGRVRADNQAIGAQFLFWMLARLGLSSQSALRLGSIAVASIAYMAAALGGIGGWGKGRPLMPTRTALFAGAAAALAPGVLLVSSLARYSSLIGPLWLLVFLLTVRVVAGEVDLALPLGLAAGMSSLISYTAFILAVCIIVSLARTMGPRVRAFTRFAIGYALGLLPVVVWLLVAGTDHIHNILRRVGTDDVPFTVRSLVGKTYELLAWTIVGPASLPTVFGIAVILVFGMILVGLMLVTIKRGDFSSWVTLVFLFLPLPFLQLTHTMVGWSMVGQTAIVGFMAAAGLRLRTSSVMPAMGLVTLLSVVSLFPVADLSILRPVNFSSRAEEAVHVGLNLDRGRQCSLVAGDWALQLLSEQATEGPVVSVYALSGMSTPPECVITLFQDAGTSGQRAIQAMVQDALHNAGLHRVSGPILVAPYDHLALRHSLGLVSRSAQYSVAKWSGITRAGDG